jgi:hypothetical protein
MTLGCGSWGGNVTSDNISPLHLMDIKRVAFETRPVASARPAVLQAASPVHVDGPSSRAFQPAGQPAGEAAGGTTRKINREEIAAIVDRFLSNRASETPAPALPVANSPAPMSVGNDVEEGSKYASPSASPQPEAAPTATSGSGNGRPAAATPSASTPSNGAAQPVAGNGAKAVDFVCEDDVRLAIRKGEKIFINAKTIITPAARDMGEASEVFGKG